MFESKSTINNIKSFFIRKVQTSKQQVHICNFGFKPNISTIHKTKAKLRRQEHALNNLKTLKSNVTMSCSNFLTKTLEI